MPAAEKDTTVTVAKLKELLRPLPNDTLVMMTTGMTGGEIEFTDAFAQVVDYLGDDGTTRKMVMFGRLPAVGVSRQ